MPVMAESGTGARALGASLRDARTARALSHAQMAASTKLSPTVLRTLEAGDFAQLPGGIIMRGYLRAYARAVGLDPEAVVARYMAVCEPEEPQLPAPAGPSWRDRASQAAAALVIAGAVGAAVMLSGARRAAPPVDPGPAPLASEPIVATGIAVPSTGLYARAGTLRLDIEPIADCWVSILVDGRNAFQGVLTPGNRISLDAWDQFVIRIGAPRAFAFALNGHPGRALGGSHPITLTITTDDYEGFVADPAIPPIGT